MNVYLGFLLGVVATTVGFGFVVNAVIGKEVVWETLVAGLFTLVGGGLAYAGGMAQANATKEVARSASRNRLNSRALLAYRDLEAVVRYFSKIHSTTGSLRTAIVPSVTVSSLPNEPQAIDRILNNLSEFDPDLQPSLSYLQRHRDNCSYRVNPTTVNGRLLWSFMEQKSKRAAQHMWALRNRIKKRYQLR